MSPTTDAPKYPYLPETPALLAGLLDAPSLQRLKRVGMNCGCEYTAFPIFRRPDGYHRYEHSLGVAEIVWRFTQDPKQAVAGLLHDIATPAFAHVIDFVRHDYLRQEATEAGTRELIEQDAVVLRELERLGVTVEDVCDYHRYPVADNDSPRLSADRLEYTLGNVLHYGFDTPATVRTLYEDLTVIPAEDGAPEIAFQHAEPALRFAQLALRCSKLYVSPEDRYAMQRLAEVVRQALALGALTGEALYGTEPEVIAALQAHPDTAKAWTAFTRLSRVRVTGSPEGCVHPRRIPAKKRFIDPLIRGRGRVSAVFPFYRDALNAFLADSQALWISEAPEPA